MEVQAELLEEEQPLFTIEQTDSSICEAQELAEKVLKGIASSHGLEITARRREALARDAVIRVYSSRGKKTLISIPKLRQELYQRMSETIEAEITVAKKPDSMRKGATIDEQVMHQSEFKQSLAELRENKTLQATVLNKTREVLAEQKSPEALLADTPNIQDLVTNFIAWFVYSDERFDDCHRFIVMAILYLDATEDEIWEKLEFMQKKDKKQYAISQQSLMAKYRQVKIMLETEGEKRMQEFVEDFVATRDLVPPETVVPKTDMDQFLNYWDIKALQHGNEAALERIIANYKPFISSLVRKKLALKRRGDYADRSNIMQQTFLGVAEKFAMADPNKGRIDTYIGYHVRSVLDRAIHKDERVKKTEYYHRVATILGEDPDMSDEEIAECAKCSVDFVAKVREMLKGRYLELDRQLGDEGDSGTYADFILPRVDKESPEAILIEQEKIVLARRILDLLPGQAQEMVRAYYFEGMTLEEIGEVHAISRQRVEQLLNGIILGRLNGGAALVRKVNVLTLVDKEGFIVWLEDHDFTPEQQEWIMLYMGFREGSRRRYNNTNQIMSFFADNGDELPDIYEVDATLGRFKQLQRADKSNGQELGSLYTSETVTQSFRDAALLCKRVQQEWE